MLAESLCCTTETADSLGSGNIGEVELDTWWCCPKNIGETNAINGIRSDPRETIQHIREVGKTT